MPELEQKQVKLVDIENEMKDAYIDYAMSVIVGRALPDVRDGLKPVHRRILYAMYDLGITPDKSHKKSARIVGEVLGKYHPHGDTAVYDTMVRMAQDFSYRYMLVDGHGNFGSVDGDSAAAMRYTEARMSNIATELLSDIKKDTVDFQPNFDDTLEEPEVLPAKLPNLLINGSSGIAVGMSTNIPPHNLSEVVDGLIAMMEDPDIEIIDLMKIIKGPDFPTGGLIMGRKAIKKAFETGRGKLTVRARTEIEEMNNNKSRIIVHELPYQVNKAKLVEQIADLVKDEKVTGISDLRDESDRNGMRIVIELKQGVNPKITLNKLFKHTRLQNTFGIIMLALVDGEPKVLNLKEVLEHYLEHQKEVVTRRTQYDLNKAAARAHILEGLEIALDNIDKIIKIVRGSDNADIAKDRLMSEFELTEKQAKAILSMRLQRLTGLERVKIQDEYKELVKKIKYYESILASDEKLLEIIKEEILELKEEYKDERRTDIVDQEIDIDMEDLIKEEEIVITLTNQGYIKRIPLDTYRSQHRGGKGIIGVNTNKEDFVENLYTTSTHNYLLFFTNQGRVYRLKGYQIPEASRQAKGTAIVNLLEIAPDEKITAVIPIKEFKKDKYLMMATKQGIIKKTDLEAFDTNYTGLIAIDLKEDDELISVKPTVGEEEIILGTEMGLAIRFSESEVRSMGRTARGVKGIDLAPEDQVIGMDIIREGAQLLVITDQGYGKRTSLNKYRPQSRAGKGLITLKRTEKNGKLIALRVVEEDDEIMLISEDGILIRISVAGISSTGRNTQGVRVMTLSEGDQVVSLGYINNKANDEEENVDEENKEENKDSIEVKE
ncbi:MULTISPECIES: DNA gyrase subunit A [unclassified Candidatus Frackibacter]|uniref:DNA gyrase subunit A n=1 Tax=unclassified Candidatus Frackibacter TaxID=2648818 RepID=UPI00087E26FE|nr:MULTISPECIES: DNA gyrase subunit A [unclassified Candidatus Frackibacter]SDC43457.1 DNA gyrase subunit A [Candidatus Frackibacter sp. WG11]SEM63904.1 DNA gyrase subunit A [Candidatus Frackibacter sp. WG12]SFL68933.1 DNA gyrase subunit A [Candidatus Frackibacter sp. WG13]